MIDYEKLKPVLEGYKKYFPKHWKDEKYKWEAVKQFQTYWNIEAENFGDMFKQATEKTANLLAMGHAYPKAMILNFIEADSEKVRQMFRDLYKKEEDLAVRVEKFQEAAEEMRVKYDDGTWNNNYQSTNAISTYLWLRFPDNYYIYKYELAHSAALELGSDYNPKRNGSAESMIEGFKLYDEIREAAMKDEEICSMIRNAVVEEGCWKDEQLHTAAIDIAFYFKRFYLDEKNKGEDERWLPKDYTPGLSVEDWTALLNDNSVFTLNSLKIVRRMKDCGGQATCTQLAAKYGESVNFYNSGSTALAKRIAEKTGCTLMQTEDNDYKWWPVLYMGRVAEKDEEGSFVWCMREELSEALENTDLSYVPLYAEAKPTIWKISHGTDSTGIPKAKRVLFESRNAVVVHGKTKAIASSKVSQGQAFTDVMKKGDYFYLCWGNSIRLLGQIISEKPVLNPEMENDWYEWRYRLIANSKDISAYTNTKKWWTPNYNSTCVSVNDSEKNLFEELILKPYFDMTIDELYGNKEISPEITETEAEKYTKEDFLNEVYMTAEKYEALKELLLYKRNVILQGAPGVGKTFSAKKLAYSIMGKKDDSRIELIQFHQNYSYEDFIMGYRPDEGGFKLTEGIFYRFCKLALANRGKEYFFIIDEINRGNLSKIFGELLLLIEKDYRDTKAVLAYTGEEFAVPDNLFIIGMMNTADRSLAMIDYALRRRFSFFEIEPGFNSEGFKKYQQQFESETFNALIEQIKKLNKAIADDKYLGKGFRIGHSYFCGIKKNEFSVERLRSVVEFDILPMLNEYWFDEPKNIKDWENNLRGVFNDE
ncbi:MAG: AAA family ATPase [Clostridiales bacterium]|nr:AAA family ATPase [Clostridiales bacterium]